MSSTALNFPSDVLKWMKKNAESRNARKLMSTCKYFYDIKLLITVIKNVELLFDIDWEYFTLSGQYKTVKSKNLLKNLLLIGEFNVSIITPISQVLKYTWCCNLKKIVCTDQRMSFSDFKFLTSGGKVKQFIIIDTRIYFYDGILAPLDMILKHLQNAVKIYISGNIHVYGPTENMAFPKLEELTLWKISVNFSIEEFTNFMIKNQKVKYYLVFGHSLNQEYIQRIQESFDEIVQTWHTKYNPPQIIFPCQTQQSLKKMDKLRRQYLKMK